MKPHAAGTCFIYVRLSAEHAPVSSFHVRPAQGKLHVHKDPYVDANMYNFSRWNPPDAGGSAGMIIYSVDIRVVRSDAAAV